MRAPCMLAVLAVGLLSITDALAEPWFGWNENSLEDRYADGDLDDADLLGAEGSGLRAGTNQMHGDTWLSVAGFTRELEGGRTDVGGFVVVGLALDRWAAGDVRKLAEPPRGVSPAWPKPPPSSPPPMPAMAMQESVEAVSPSMARECVRAALRASRLDTDEERIDALAAKARASAWLPETRLRAMRLLDTTLRTTALTTTDGVDYYDSAGANLILEVRLTWRLDRVLYAGDEPTLERLRLEREQARAHLATRALEALFAWQRALSAREHAIPGSPEDVEARMRVAETRAVLDVMTDGWFTQRGPEQAAGGAKEGPPGREERQGPRE